MARTDKRPTMNEVAQHAGVALSSVSRVLNNHPDVSKSMQARVLESIVDLDYEPNLLASDLRRGTSRTIGFIVPDIANPLFAEIVRSAQRPLNAAGYTAVLTNSNGDAARDEELLRLLRRRQVDGLIVSLADETHRGILNELRRFEGPVVLLDRRVEGLESASAVEADHAKGVGEATEHLLGLGHHRVALITGPPNVRPSEQRLGAFQKAYEERCVKFPEDLVRLGSFAPDFGESTTSELLEKSSPPTAIIAGGNPLLVGVLRALRKRYVDVGKDMALISFDDVPLAELYSPPITVVNRDLARMGEAAAELALERLEDPDTEPRTVVLPPWLVLRDSTFEP